MKKILCLLCVMVILFLATGCDMVPPHPKRGIWYCEELDITLDMGHRTAAYQNDEGAYEIAEFFFHVGSTFEIARETDADSLWEMILLGYYKYEDDVLYVTDEMTNTTYTFVLTVDR